jgi:hypothetical protein
MRAKRSLAAAAIIALASCSAATIPGGAVSLGTQGDPQVVPASMMTGFVESYGEGDIRLLAGGAEVQLFGAIQDVIPHGGLQITVSGRQLDSDRFWVEEVTASAPVRNAGAHAHVL